MIRLYNDNSKKINPSGKLRLYSDSQIKTFEEQNKPKTINPVQLSETPKVGILDVIKGLPGAATKLGGEVYNAIGGMAIPGATPEELRNPQILKDTIFLGLPKAAVSTYKQLYKPEGIGEAILGTARGVSDSVTDIIINNFVKPEEREATRTEVQKTLDKYISPVEGDIMKGFQVGGSAAPIIAGGAAGKAIAGGAGAVAGFMGVGQASLPRESDLETRAVQAVKDLSILGLFAIGSKAYNDAKGVIKNGIKESYKIKTEPPKEPPPPGSPSTTKPEAPKIRLYPEETGRPLSAKDIRSASESGMTVGEFKDVMEKTSGIKTPGTEVKTELPAPVRKPGVFMTNVATEINKGAEIKPKSQEYLYHGTNEVMLDSISKEGLKPSRKGTLSLSKDEVYSKSYARDGMTPHGKTNGVMFRVKADLLEGKTVFSDKPRPASDQLNEILTKETIPPSSLEVSRDGGKTWSPLINPTIPKPPTAKQIASEAKAQELGYKPTEPQKLQSRVYERMKEEFQQERGYAPEGMEKDVLYNEVNLKRDAEKAIELIKTDKEKAYRIAMGAEKSAEVTSTSVNIALAEKALIDGNHSLYSKLIKNRSLEQTRRGQEIVAEKGSVTDNSTSRYVKDLIAVRMEKIGKSYLGDIKNIFKKRSPKQKAIERIDKEVNKAKEKINNKELDIKEAQSLIDKLMCK